MYTPACSENSDSTQFDFVDSSMMLPQLFMFLVLQYSSYVYSFDRSYCAKKTGVSVYKGGDIVVAAFFPLHTIVYDSITEDPSSYSLYHQ